MKPYSISVPTKQGQGDQTEKRTMYLASQHQQDDAFSRYSNNFVRMKSLLLYSGDEEDDGNEYDDLDTLARINRALSGAGLTSLSHLNRGKRRRGNNSSCIKQGHERKTRLSWELHPSLLLHDFIEELEALDNGTHRILDTDDEEVEGEESSKNKPNGLDLEQEAQEKKE
mmetsp:Transcript_3835/g.5588  ORF Transcript_3835/g.5588 Transcript_3835/m.5588 type:complete len:170 (-) Transcript_3835:95-604(-)